MLLYKSGLSAALESDNVRTVKPFDFSKNTTYGLGGFSEIAYMPNTIWQVKKVFGKLKSCDMPVQIIGNGSNVLVSDKGAEAVVISTRRLRGIIRLSGDRLLCLAGTNVSQLLNYCRKNELSGLEYLYGIPATLGGAAYMNAGVSGMAIGNNIESVRIFDDKDRILTAEKCNFGYRRSTMRDINAIILSIIVKVKHSSISEIDERINYYKARRSHLPKGRSCGCVFKNPEGNSAGYLIEAAGLKGLRIGGAVVSDKHASFIINENGKSSDVKTLIETVKKRVFDKFGVHLSEEVVYIGEFNEFNG